MPDVATINGLYVHVEGFPTRDDQGKLYSVDGLRRINPDRGQVEVWSGTTWARDQDQSVGESRTATSNIEYDGFEVFTVSDGTLGLGVVDVVKTVGSRDLWMDETTFGRIEDNPKLEELLTENARRWKMGKKYLAEDVSMSSFFQDAVKRDAAAAERDAREVLDRISELKGRANGLLIQAATYNGTPSPTLAESFGLRLAEVQQELGELQAELDAVADIVGLASTAVMDAFS